MYTKVFRSIYDGTLADNWQAMVTFQQLLILANDDGVVDMTLAAIHRTTGIPHEILAAGIAALEAPDAGSRTPDMEGRRISRLDAHRDWGWFLVNFSKYRRMLTREDKKEADRSRIADKRAEKKDYKINDVAKVALCSNESQPVASVANVAHTEADTEAERALPTPNGVGVETPVSTLPDVPIKKIVELYHEKLPELPKVEKITKARTGMIRQRWKEDLPTLEAWSNYFADIRGSPFLMGRATPTAGRPPFIANIDFLCRPASFANIAEGKYHR